MDVYIVRHAIAENRDSERWPDDSKRPLTPDGIARFRTAASGLRRIAPNVDRLLTSPYVRAVQTAEIVRDVTGWPAPETTEALEAVASPADGVALLQSLDRTSSVALVGHEPYLSSLMALLLAGDEGGLQIDLKKGGVALLECGESCRPGSALLRWSATPRLLRRAAGS